MTSSPRLSSLCQGEGATSCLFMEGLLLIAHLKPWSWLARRYESRSVNG